MKILSSSFYNRSPLLVAPDLLGKILIRTLNGTRISGRITEVEAYLAAGDEAAHGHRGLTKTNTSLFLPAGHAYVHRIHMQHCLDVVTDEKDIPSSVLIRVLHPVKGVEQMKLNRNKEKLKDLTSGPGKLCQALKIDMKLDGVDVTDKNSPLQILDDGYQIESFQTSKRIGISKSQDFEYRFHIKSNPPVSTQKAKST